MESSVAAGGNLIGHLTLGMAPPGDVHASPPGLGSGSEPSPINIRRVTNEDLKQALMHGFDDWRACRTDALVMVVLYPIAGLFTAGAIADQALLPFVFPVCAGFALLGPLATMWFAALSLMRERNGTATAEAAAELFDGQRLVTIQRLAFIIIVLFLAWIALAAAIYGVTLGGSNENAAAGFVIRLFTTGAGYTMIGVGCLVGAMFAAVVLAIGLISFPLALDRPVTTRRAVTISFQAVRRNPLFALRWGALIVAGLVLGAIPALLGLAVILPVLCHANWHLYRRMIG